MNKKKQETAEEKMPDPAKAVREMYDQFWKQAAEQWDEVARSPQFLSMMASNLNQSLDLKARVQEMAVAALRSMNILTREDLSALTSRLDRISEQVAELDRKLTHTSTKARAKKPQAKKTVGKKRGGRKA
jgi:hypothetical protein